MKIVSTGATISSPEFYQKKLKARRNRLIRVSLLVCALLAAIILISRMESLRISHVTASGADIIGEEAVKEISLQALSGNHLWLIPKDNALIYSKGRVMRELEESFPRFSSIEISLTDLDTLHVSVAEREPYALYCSGDDVASCYFLDEEGFVFDKAPSFSEGVYFTYLSDLLPLNPLGLAFMPAEEFEPLVEFIENLERIGISAASLALREGELQLSLENGGMLLLKRDSDLSRIYSNLESFLGDEEIRKQADFMERIAELDLRTDNKVFYSFKQ